MEDKKNYNAAKNQVSSGFRATIQTIERTDQGQKKLTPDFFGLGVFMEENGGISPVPFFSWFSDCDIKNHEKNGKKFVEIIITRPVLINIFQHFKAYLDSNRMGTAMMKHWHCHGVFFKISGKVAWQYPPYSRRTASPVDVQNLITETGDGFQIGF